MPRKPGTPLHSLAPTAAAKHSRSDDRVKGRPQGYENGDFGWCHAVHDDHGSEAVLIIYFNLELILHYQLLAFDSVYPWRLV